MYENMFVNILKTKKGNQYILVPFLISIKIMIILTLVGQMF
jgi:hypothetical protein